MLLQATAHSEPTRIALDIYEHVLRGVRADQLVKNSVTVSDDALQIGNQLYFLSGFRKIWICGAGKASTEMAGAVADLLGDFVAGGLVVAKSGTVDQKRKMPFEVITGSHPIPDAASLLAGYRMLAFAHSVDPRDLVIFCLSGGASAMMEALQPGLSLDQLQVQTDQWLASGKPIHQVNAERIALSQIKGGGLAKAFLPATVVCLVLSDVVSGGLASVGSGPLWHPEVPHEAIGSVSLAIQMAVARGNDLGIPTFGYQEPLAGEARRMAKTIVDLGLRHAKSNHGSFCLVFGGETTVTLDYPGKGGRCQEMALTAAIELAGREGLGFLAAGTDGMDGPTEAAGATADSETLGRSVSLGLHAEKMLDEHNSFHFLSATDNLIKTGPTGSNVNDLAILVRIA